MALTKDVPMLRAIARANGLKYYNERPSYSKPSKRYVRIKRTFGWRSPHPMPQHVLNAVQAIDANARLLTRKGFSDPTKTVVYGISVTIEDADPAPTSAYTFARKG